MHMHMLQSAPHIRDPAPDRITPPASDRVPPMLILVQFIDHPLTHHTLAGSLVLDDRRRRLRGGSELPGLVLHEINYGICSIGLGLGLGLGLGGGK